MTSLCLNMIVKNESHIIEHTLENICQHFPISYWVISDTGSTDNTIEKIINFFQRKNIAGEIHQEKWRDFAYNRNQALTACKDKAEYILFFDADDWIEGTLLLPELKHDAYQFQFTDEFGTVRFMRQMIIKNHQHYFWKGVLHERLLVDAEMNEVEVRGDYLVISGRKGNRNLDPQKARKDAMVLEQAFQDATELMDQARYAFYCAQSYAVYATQNDPQYLDKAIEWYCKRIALTLPWLNVDDEKYVSYENLGTVYEKKLDFQRAKQTWKQGIELDPLRAECLYHLIYRLHIEGELLEAYTLAKQAVQLKMPKGNRVFLNQSIYEYWCLHQLCILSWKLDRLDESYQTFKILIQRLPAEYVVNLQPIIQTYVPLIFNDRYSDVIQLQSDFEQLGFDHYFKSLVRVKI